MQQRSRARRSVFNFRRDRLRFASVWDYRDAARRRLPQALFEFLDGGSYDELTVFANRSAFEEITFRPRVMRDVSERSTAVNLLGRSWSQPLALAPTGFVGLGHADGEILAARAASAARIPFCLSTMSICSLEDVAAASPDPIWFQLYLLKDREMTRALVDRAQAARCDTLVLTMDVAIPGRRNRDLHNGLTSPPRFSPAMILDGLIHVPWLVGMAQTSNRTLGTLKAFKTGETGLGPMLRWVGENFSPGADLADLAWLRERWTGKLLIKGILDAEEARLVADSGADGIIVSNHGGRQLDGAPASARVVGEIAQAVGDRVTVLLDSGVRSGLDVLKGLGLGASACLIGRAYLYGLAARGEAGVSDIIAMFAEELDAGLALTGNARADKVGRDVLRDQSGF